MQYSTRKFLCDLYLSVCKLSLYGELLGWMYRFREPQNTQAHLLYRAKILFFFVLLMIAIISLLLISFYEIEAKMLLFILLHV